MLNSYSRQVCYTKIRALVGKFWGHQNVIKMIEMSGLMKLRILNSYMPPNPLSPKKVLLF